MATTVDALRESNELSSPPRPWRLRCARLTAKIVTRLRVPGLDWLAGFRRPYPTLEAARLAAAAYLPYDHSHPDNVALHLSLSERLRPSDYPVLYHLHTIPEVHTVFDLGGNVGNLYYLFRQHLRSLQGVRWLVLDIPEITSVGESIAIERHAAYIEFVNSQSRLPEADVLLISGSLHYFEESLPDMLQRQKCRPKHVLINRTPLLPDCTTCTVQDAGTFLVACKLHSRDALVTEMESFGYELVDQWLVPELSLVIPGHPKLSAYCYSGLYFRLR